MNWQTLWSVLLAWASALIASTHFRSALLSLVGIASTTLVDAITGAHFSAFTAAVLTGVVACLANAVRKALETPPPPVEEDDEGEWY